jgi:hypothetical protein
VAGITDGSLLEWVFLPRKGNSGRARDYRRQAVAGFTRWCAGTGRLGEDLLADVERIKGDDVRPRRSLDAADLQRLLDAARKRPLENQLSRLRRAKKGGGGGLALSEEFLEGLRWAGEQRALVYQTAVLVLSRYGVIRGMRVRALHLDGERPFARARVPIAQAMEYAEHKDPRLTFRVYNDVEGQPMEDVFAALPKLK